MSRQIQAEQPLRTAEAAAATCPTTRYWRMTRICGVRKWRTVPSATTARRARAGARSCHTRGKRWIPRPGKHGPLQSPVRAPATPTHPPRSMCMVVGARGHQTAPGAPSQRR
jgi:hypothetical protein